MNTAAVLFCQTGGRWKLAGRQWRRIAAVAGYLAVSLTSRGTPPTEPTAWQGELNALRLSEAALSWLPPARTVETAESNRRLDTLFRDLVAKYPREAAVRKAAGDHFWQRGQIEAANAEWEAAQALDPNNADTAESLGSARLRAGQVRAAYGQYQCAVSAQPNVARYHFELGNVLYLFRHQLAGLPAVPDEAAALHGALAELRRARDLAPSSLEYAQAYAETFYGLPEADWNEALEAWEFVRKLSGDSPDFALSHLARISLRLCNADEAERYLDRIHDPRFSSLQTKLRRRAVQLRSTGASEPR